jgi:hypothetical protein
MEQVAAGRVRGAEELELRVGGSDDAVDNYGCRMGSECGIRGLVRWLTLCL